MSLVGLLLPGHVFDGLVCKGWRYARLDFSRRVVYSTECTRSFEPWLVLVTGGVSHFCAPFILVLMRGVTICMYVCSVCSSGSMFASVFFFFAIFF